MAEVRGFCVELIDLGVTLVKPSTFPGWRHPWLCGVLQAQVFLGCICGLRRAAWPNVFCYKLNIYVYVVIATVAVPRFCLQLRDAFFFRSGPTIHIEILLFIQGTNVSCEIVIPGNHGRFFQDMSWQLPCQFCGTGKILKELPQMSGRIVSLACIESMSEDRGPRAREYQLFKENYSTSRCGIFTSTFGMILKTCFDESQKLFGRLRNLFLSCKWIQCCSLGWFHSSSLWTFPGWHQLRLQSGRWL